MAANFGDGRHKPAAAATKFGGLIFAIVICRLAATAAATNSMSMDSPLAEERAAAQRSDLGPDSASGLAAQQTACDSLFIASEKLAKYCLCKDQQPLDSASAPIEPQLPPVSAATAAATQRPATVLQISQLSCQPDDLSSLSTDLSSVLMGRRPLRSEHEEELTFQIDYLNINTNISAAAAAAIRPSPSAIVAPADRWPHRRRFQIDHISLQLHPVPSVDESPAVASERRTTLADGRRNGAESQQPTTRLEDQMIDFCGLINETHLQFLSIFIAGESSGELSAMDHELAYDAADAMNEIRLTKMLAKLSSLTRLELNLDTKSHSLIMDREMIRHQTHLKWLNLASNRRLNFSSVGSQLKRRSPFAWSTQLEYLSLKSCELDRFPLFSLFPIQFKLASSQDHSTRANSSSGSFNGIQVATKSVFGLPNLTTLNLASNRIKSLEHDLFSSFDSNDSVATSTVCNQDLASAEAASKRFVLPSLIQLDLSENQLDGLTFRAGQYILCTMPNLSQLFLRRNHIKHLNLNSLLAYPITRLPHPATCRRLSRVPDSSICGADQTAENGMAVFDKPFGRARSSRLEYLDLSQNKLVQMSAIVPFVADDSATRSSIRMKSINLSQNMLTNLITLINSTLIDRVIFDESFHYSPSSNNTEYNAAELGINQLERSFRLSTTRLSICDLLSPIRLSLKNTFENNDNMEESLINEISMTENRLTRITVDDFSGQQCAEVQILRLSGNRIQSISGRAFESLINLEQIDLSSNALVNLETSTFMKQRKLRILDLGRNQIRTLDKILLMNLHELEELFLNDNELSELPSDLFAQTSRLDVLDLSRNRLTYLDETIFSNLRRLRVLDLNSNQLKNANYLSLFKHIDDGILVKTMNKAIISQPKKVSERMGKKQKQSSKQRSSSESMKKVKTRRTRDTFEDANSILDLAGNQLEAFDHAMGDSDSCNNQTFALNVQLLWLNDNKLRDLHADSFKCFQSIHRLYLQSNLLQTLDDSMFQSLTLLESLDLSRNLLTQFDLSSILSRAPTLKHVDVSSNRLLSLNLPTSETAETQLEFLDASLNANLNIDSVGLVDFVAKSASLRSISFSGIRQIKSAETEVNATRQQALTETKSRSYLERLDMSGCQIEFAAISTLHHFLSNEQIALESLSIGNMTKEAISQAAMQRLIARRLHMELELLDLSGNQLDTDLLKLIMNADSLAEPTKTDEPLALKHLNLSSNSLDSWPFSIRVSRKLAELRTLDLSKNKIRYLINRNDSCFSCYSFRQLDYLNLSFNAMIGLIAQPPAQNLGQKVSLGQLIPMLKGVDLSHNRLSWIPVQFFEDLLELVWLRLDHNHLETFPSSLLLLASTNRLAHIDFDYNRNMRSLALGAQPDTASGPSDQVRGSDYERSESLIGAQSELIILPDHRSNQIRCLRVEDYVSELERQQTSLVLSGEVNSIHGPQSKLPYLHALRAAQHSDILASAAGTEVDSSDNARCHTLISLTRSISFNSIGANASANLDSSLWETRDDTYSPAAHKLYDLSFRHNDLHTIENGDKAAGIIRLDLSGNRIERIALPSPSTSSMSCWPDLMTLDLSHNLIRDLPFEWVLTCAKLTYLDLSHNKINSFVSSLVHQNARGSVNHSSLLVLKLHHNSLSNLDRFPSYLLERLHLLDLRSNQLKTAHAETALQLGGPQLTVIQTNSSQLALSNIDAANKPVIRLDDTSVRLEWSADSEKNLRENYSLNVVSANHALDAFAEQSIKFCTLNPHNLTRICLHERASHSQLSHHRCFLLKVPKNTLPCMTDLQQAQTPIKSNASEISAKLSQSMNGSTSHHLASVQNTTSGPVDEEDYVLDFIDLMKKNWLKLRHVDINEYLAENLRAGSVWVKLSGQYQISSMTVIKLAIVISSVCMIGLLVAIFILLTTYFSGSNKIVPDQSDSGSASELTTVTSPADSTASFLSSSNVINSRSSAATDCSNGSSAGSTRIRASLQSSSEETQHLHETVLDPSSLDRPSSKRLDGSENVSSEYHNLLQQLQQRPQICVTPSSSLAPSSIETAETMQAVDSIQSGTPSNVIARGSVDQYTSADVCSQQDRRQQDLYEQEQPQVATVMRMVKSSSSSFEQNSNRQKINAHLGAAAVGQLYGTMNPRQQQNYSTLRTKMRQYHSPSCQIQTHYTSGVSGLSTNDESRHLEPETKGSQSYHQHLGTDPATMSLLSLSSALSNSTSNSNFGELNSMEARRTGCDDQTDYQHNLCHYHSRMMHHDHPGHITTMATSQQPPPEVIFEQEEDQLPNNMDQPGLNQSLHNLPPPPPPPRAMEALEFYDVNALISNNRHNDQR